MSRNMNATINVSSGFIYIFLFEPCTARYTGCTMRGRENTAHVPRVCQWEMEKELKLER